MIFRELYDMLLFPANFYVGLRESMHGLEWADGQALDMADPYWSNLNLNNIGTQACVAINITTFEAFAVDCGNMPFVCEIP